MNAMTWWDHETDSVWSQPWGMAIAGPMEGTRLELIPANIVPWQTWFSQHPETLVLEAGGPRSGGVGGVLGDGHVIGITLGQHAKAYPYSLATAQQVINDQVGPFAIVVVADAATKAVSAYLRQVEDQELKFTFDEGRLVDRPTGSTWDVSTGLAVDGPLRGELLKKNPLHHCLRLGLGRFLSSFRVLPVKPVPTHLGTVQG